MHHSQHFSLVVLLLLLVFQAPPVAAQATTLPSPRILNIGWALFTTLLLGGTCIIAFLISSAFAKTSSGNVSRTSIVTLVSATVFGVVVLTLRYLPKVPVGYVVQEAEVVDKTYHARIAFAVLSTIFSVVSAGCSAAFYAFSPIYARPADDE
ncbi:uncharacterized protein SPPG_05171 [Spizellomyces punctatus DAOM BR117]|uniref:Uncharacterized protein n=1 Tax=Spizellomyces punctatus (strain DAOM BR117) TaxID=645134 RepID=A0A0L0HEA7_SPIPD|nr:uncharacterized protein SPPG_05171 [Spizellomyces punctatus DAOM BR117]KNC99795.1 hypothetical protein SPPG_05171 [Spizellomyces punctatus DAOM BR117]|eukprot:XP_016607835.1 hypothetical protein SPPG_05171 [Spizellomyces punctatus DAOM BR117]